MKNSFRTLISGAVIVASMVAVASLAIANAPAHASTKARLLAPAPMRIQSGLDSGNLAVPAMQIDTASKPRVKYTTSQACKPARKGRVSCLAVRRTAYVNGVRQHGVLPATGTAFGAPALRKAYGITTLGARYKVIAVVDAMHSGTAFEDLAGYRNLYQLGAMENCGVSNASPTKLPNGKNPCFLQLDQTGKVNNSSQTTDVGWAQEIALDIEMASAVCPHCSVLLVEANSPSFADLDAAVRTAANFAGVLAISNSYGGPDIAEYQNSAFAYATGNGIAVTASSGDSGYGVSAPASFASVIGVGGTRLTANTNGSWAQETAWAKGGSGCSKLNPRAEWQGSKTGCPGKSVVDVAAVADPATGVTVFYSGEWYTFGGTSAASPIVAALFALKGNFAGDAGGFLSKNAAQLHDITDGSNGTCPTLIWCNAAPGFDGPTGLGTPAGTAAF